MNKQYDVFVISDDVVGVKMAGPGIRAWEISRILAQHFKVVLAVPDFAVTEADKTMFAAQDFEVLVYSLDEPELITSTGAKSRIILFQGYILSKFPGLKKLEAYLIADLYVPFPLETLFIHKWKVPDLKDREYAHQRDLQVFNDQIAAGDFFLCANERQRDLFMGSLLSLNRINSSILECENDMDDLIRIVPFGISPSLAQTGPNTIRERLKGITQDDILLIWGGVITNWFDPKTLLYALEEAVKTEPRLKLLFLSTGHPNPKLPEFDMAVACQRLSEELGLTEKHVFFNSEWIDYSERGAYFAAGDIGVSIHETHFETRFSFRTRILDYLKYDLPVICTEGDYFAGLVKKEGLGLTVPSGDVERLTAALLELAGKQESRTRFVRNIQRIKPDFYWDKVTEPLVAHCRKVLAGEIDRNRKPAADEIIFCCVGSENEPGQRTRNTVRRWENKLPFWLLTRLKRLYSKMVK